jgi:hypothetical protein
MSFSVNETLAEVRAEIARLQAIEKALLGASDGSVPKKQGQGMSPTGAAVISLASKLRFARERKDSKDEVKKLESELAEARKRHTAFKAAQKKG